MSAEIKDAHSEFINNNSSTIDKIMEGDNNVMNKDDHSLQDLVCYLADPTQPLSHKDSMMIDEKGNLQDPNFSSAQIHTTHQSLYSSIQVQGAQDHSHIDMSDMCCSSSDASYNSGNLQSSDTSNSHSNIQHHQEHQFLQHHNSFDLGVYPDSSGGESGVTDMIYTSTQAAAQPVFESNSSTNKGIVDQGHLQTMASVGSKTQFYNNEPNTQFQSSVSTDSNFHHSLQAQYSDNNGGQFQTQPQPDPGSFQNSPVLPSSYTSPSITQLHFSSTEENLGFSMMDVNHTLSSRAEPTGQFKVPEKMHVDEPEGIYQGSHNSNTREYHTRFQFKAGDVSRETDMQTTFNPEGCHQQSNQHNSFNIGLDVFSQPLTNSGATSDNFTVSGGSSSCGQNNIPFDTGNNIYTESTLPGTFDPSSFLNKNLLNSASLQASSTDFQMQQSSIPTNSSVEMHFTPTQSSDVVQSQSPEFAMQSSPNPSHHSYSPSQTSPSQGNQFQELTKPTLSDSSPCVQDTYQQAMSSIQAQSPEFQIHSHSSDNSVQFQQNLSSHQQPPAEQNPFQQSPGSEFVTAETIGPGHLSGGYQNSLTSPSHSSDQSLGSIGQQQNYISPPDMQQIPNLDGSNGFINFTGNTEVSLPQVQEPSDTNKSAGDLSLDSFAATCTSELGSFPVETDAFPHLDLVSVVNGNFPVDPNLSSVQHRSLNIDGSAETGVFNPYQFEDTNTSISFSSTPHTISNITSQAGLEFSQPTQTTLPVSSSMSTYIDTQQTSSLTSSSDSQEDRYRVETSQFTSNKVEQRFGFQTNHEHYPQPMQVQESGFASKIPEAMSTYPYQNHNQSRSPNDGLETAMDISSNQAERSISYEEIHRSIVKAGDQFAGSNSDANSNYITPRLHLNSDTTTNLSDNSQPVYSTESSGFYEAAKPVTSYSAMPETSTACTTSSSPYSSDSSFAPIISNSFESSLSALQQSTITDLLNSIQSSSAETSTHLHDVRNQISGSVPNFLDTPRASAAGTESMNQVTGSLMTQSPVSQTQACFVVTMSAISQNNTEPVLTTSSLSQPKLAIVTNPSISTNQQVLNTSTITLGQNMFPNPILVSPFVNFSAAVSSTTASLSAQPQIVTTNNIGKKPGVNFAGPSTGSLPFLVQIPSHQLESKTSSHQNISTLAGKLNLSAVPVQKTNMATIVIPTTGTPVPKNNSQNNQQIFMSLEELQKLLSQEGLSQPSYQLQQHQQTASSSPQTLVFQKPVSQTLRQNHPKLLIRGATFPSNSRLIQPQHQPLQTRDKLPLIIQQTSPSQSKTYEQNQSLAADSSKPFQLLVNQQPSGHKLQLFQQLQVSEQQQPKISLHLKPMAVQQQPLLIPSTEQIRLPFQLHGQRAVQMQTEPKASASQLIYVTQIKQEHQQVMQQELDQEKEDRSPQLHQQVLDERSDRQCSDSLKKDYKHLHSLLTGDSSTNVNTQVKSLPSVLNFPNNLQGNFQLSNGTTIGASSISSNQGRTIPHVPASTAPFSFLPLNSTPALSLGGSFLPFSSSGPVGTTNSFPTTNAVTSNSFSAPLTTLAFTNAFSSSFFSKPAESKDSKQELAGNQLAFPQQSTQSSSQPGSTPPDGATALDSSSRSLLAQILSDRKRSHTPLSVEINSPNSNSEAPSPLSSPVPFEDASTQATLIERSADLHIKSDSMQGMNDDDDDENASFFDLNAFHKRPSTEETLSPGDKNESVPMKILKGSLNADARSSVHPPLSPEPAFDIGSVVSTASSFSFAFGSKEDNSEVFTFGSGGTGTATTDALLSTPKPALKMPNGTARSNVPTQQVRPLSRKQKEYSLKAYYSSKLDGMELRILEQPEPHHRARYQTEGSRGAIKDASQQGFPIIKLMGYNKPTKLQVFIGDECGRVKPHGFYQACRVFGKNSTTCVEQEIEGTTVIEIDILPENDMTVKLDCIGILKLRNADVERRIGPKRARDKKKNNTRARLVLRTFVEKPDGVHHVLQVVSNPIVCTQPVGQPEISRMSLTECSIEGGESLFIIGKNFKNKGTSVLFQKLDANDDTVSWQAEAEIEQEFFQPTHLICKVPPFNDQLISKPEQVQIVVSCAGKKSDSQTFTYKPVYQVASMVKQEVPMETDTVTSSTSMSFVSPEALHLNRMVHQTHAQSSTSSAMFQLPPGTIPNLQNSSTSSSSCTEIPLSHHVTLSHSAPSSSAAVSPMTSLMTNPSLSETMSDRTLQTFLLDERPDGLVSKSLAETVTSLAPADKLQSDKTQVNCTAPRNAETSELESTSYSVCGDNPTITSANSTGISNHSVSSPSLTSALSSKPFVVVLDPGSLQSDSGDKIQQLLQQILQAQSKQAF